uniref:TBC1 domain family member 20 n=2 Tax=Schistosoma japonicum TaxID=6182 RepID=C1LGJ1_SCHJA|nr:TBC1 domain family member 20 [Schistosoma japonicum]
MLSERCFKKENILQCLSKNADVKKLRHFSISRYGLVDNDVRKIVWPMLVGGNCGLSDIDPEILKNHPSCHQVELDTCRMTSLIPKESTPEEIESIQKIVTRLVLSVLVDNPSLHYYQGFHDICYIFFSVLGEKRSRILINKLIPTHFSLFMQKSMDVTLEYMQLIFALLERVSTSILTSIESVELGPDFAIAWIITWFAHVLPNMDDVRRLFDLFLATDPIMLVYVSVAIITISAKEVESTPLDFALLYQTLARLPKLHPVEELIHEALKIYIDLGPDKLIELGNKRILKYREQKLLTPSTSMRQPFPKSMHYNHLLLWNTVIQHRRTIFSLSFIVIVVSYLLNKSLKG